MTGEAPGEERRTDGRLGKKTKKQAHACSGSCIAGWLAGQRFYTLGFSGGSVVKNPLANAVQTLMKVGPSNFPAGIVVESLPANVGHLGSIPGPGRFYLLRDS